ncbi:hypothetical protein Ancab_022444 [Ancistrocladus abbreviatus]
MAQTWLKTNFAIFDPTSTSLGSRPNEVRRPNQHAAPSKFSGLSNKLMQGPVVPFPSSWISNSLNRLKSDAQGSRHHRQKYYHQGFEQCQLERINALEPTCQIKAEARVTEVWDASEDQFQWEEGHRLRDQHQKVRRLSQGDILTLPSGTAHWTYNDGDEPLVIVVLLDTSNSANQLNHNFPRRFYLAGRPQQPEHGVGYYDARRSGNIYKVLDCQDDEIISRLQSPEDDNGNIVKAERLALVRPPWSRDLEQEHKERGRREWSRSGSGSRRSMAGGNPSRRGSRRGRRSKCKKARSVVEGSGRRRSMEAGGGGQREKCGAGRCNNVDVEAISVGLEETLCTARLRHNIDQPSCADIFNPQAGRFTSLNSLKLPLLHFLDLSVSKGVLYRNAILAPHFYLNAHSVVYATRGQAHLQIVNDHGQCIFNDELRAGSVISTMPREVVARAYGLTNRQADQLKCGTPEFTLISPRVTGLCCFELILSCPRKKWKIWGNFSLKMASRKLVRDLFISKQPLFRQLLLASQPEADARLRLIRVDGYPYNRQFSVFSEFSKKIKGEATSNKEFQQSINELKGKADELKGVKEELRARTKQTTEQLYKHVDDVWKEAETTAKKVSANIKEKISVAKEEVGETFGIGKQEPSSSSNSSDNKGADTKDGSKGTSGEEHQQSESGDATDTIFGKFKSGVSLVSPKVALAYQKLKEAKVVDFAKKGYDIVKDELSGKPVKRKRMQHAASSSPTGETSSRTEIVVVPSKQSKWNKKWEAFKEKVRGHPMFKRVSKMSEPVATKSQELAEDIQERWETSDSPVVHKIQDLNEKVFGENPSALSFKEIRRRDPSFSLPEFVAEVQEVIKPILNGYIKGDVEVLKKYCSPEVVERCKAEHKAYQSQGVFFDNKILHVSDIDVRETKMMGSTPIIILAFQTQQVYCVRDRNGNVTEGGKDTIHTVYYAWAMQQMEADETGEGGIYSMWRLREMQQLGVQALI